VNQPTVGPAVRVCDLKIVRLLLFLVVEETFITFAPSMQYWLVFKSRPIIIMLDSAAGSVYVG